MKKPSKPSVLLPAADPVAQIAQAHSEPHDGFFHPDPELQALLRQAPPALQRYVLALHAVIADLEIKKIPPQPRGPAQGKQTKKRGGHDIDMNRLHTMLFGEEAEADS
jgi:hypothetical protein